MPLSKEELELLKSLETGESGSSTLSAPPPPPASKPQAWWPPPAPQQSVDAASLHAPLARSVQESLGALATKHVGFRGGERRRLLLDGVLLEPFAQTWANAPPRFFERLELETPGRLTDVGWASASALHLYARAAPDKPALALHLSALSRSADRSTGLLGSVSAGLEAAGVRATLGYNDYKDLRIAQGDQLQTRSQRWTASVRGRILGRADDPLKITLGFDLDRALNLPLLDANLVRQGRVSFQQNLLAFARVDLAIAQLKAMLLTAYQGHRRESEFTVPNASTLSTAADAFQGRLQLQYLLGYGLELRAGGHVGFSQGSATTARNFRRLEGYLGGAYRSDFLSLEIDARLVEQRAQTQQPGVQALVQARLQAPVYGPLALRATAGRGFALSGDGLLAPLSASGQPTSERSLGVSLGPSLRWESLWLDLTGFFQQLEDPLVSLVDPSAPIPPGRARAWGLELEGRWSLVEGLDLAWALAWAEAYQVGSEEAVLTIPAVRGFGALRYRFGARGAYIEARAHGSSKPLFVVSEAPSAGFLPYRQRGGAPSASARVGLLGGLELGAGFSLQLSIENLFDGTVQSPSGQLPGAGIDLRAALSYDFRML